MLSKHQIARITQVWKYSTILTLHDYYEVKAFNSRDKTWFEKKNAENKYCKKRIEKRKKKEKKNLEITEKIMIVVIFCNEPGRNKKKQQNFPPP